MRRICLVHKEGHEGMKLEIINHVILNPLKNPPAVSIIII